MCGRHLSKETSSTIGEQRRFNYALQPMSREAFVDMMTTDLPEVPAYFGRDVRLNREGPALVSELPPVHPLSPDETARRAAEGAVVLDARTSAAFGTAHVPGSIHIGLDGQFASWAGTLLPAGTPIVLVTSAAEEAAEARMRLARVGLDDVAGYLEGGIASWSAAGRPVASTEQITVDELAARLREDRCRVLDVRRPAEWREAHIAGATAGPLADLGAFLPDVPSGKPLALICAGGYRSSIAASMFERGGRREVINVVGGMAAWNASGLPTVA
jgi:rhodanese-related sulfurtransferase